MDSDSNGKPSETNNEEKEKSRQDSGETTDKTEDGKSSSSSSSSCQLEQLKNRTVKKTDGAIFWKNSWRSKLCACQSCMVSLKFVFRSCLDVISIHWQKKKNSLQSVKGDSLVTDNSTFVSKTKICISLLTSKYQSNKPAGNSKFVYNMKVNSCFVLQKKLFVTLRDTLLLYLWCHSWQTLCTNVTCEMWTCMRSCWWAQHWSHNCFCFKIIYGTLWIYSLCMMKKTESISAQSRWRFHSLCCQMHFVKFDQKIHSLEHSYHCWSGSFRNKSFQFTQYTDD